MLVSLDNVRKTFGDKLILDKLSATIEDNDRIGLIGANGVGKSTLLNIICKKLDCDEGGVYVSSGATIGLLEQNSGLGKGNNIYAEMRSVFAELLSVEENLRVLESKIAHTSQTDENYSKLSEEYSRLTAFFEVREGYQIDVKIKTILNGMGFYDKSYDMLIDDLSGGEKTRLALAKLLLEEPSLLILDEPTNHLDFKTLMWLEDYLKSYKGGLLIVSHDRYFLDKMVTKMWEVENKQIVAYNGNYSKYKVLREERITRLLKEYDAQQNKINSMVDYAQKNIARASTSNMAKSRLHQLEHIERIEKPNEVIPTPTFRFEFERNPVKDLLTVKNLRLEVGEGDDKLVLCENISFDIKRGEKVALIGPNGIGKSTLLKTILNLLTQNGEVYWGANVQTSYYEQENLTLNKENTAIEELWSRFPLLPQYTVRGILGQVLISGDNGFKKIGVLSGGERARVALAILMTEHSNTLILDEPTNHLDLQSKETLEKSLVDFEGTLIFVSHDRYFLNTIPTKIIELKRSGLNIYDGNFDFYLEQQAKITSEPTSPPAAKQNTEKSNYRSKQERAEQTKIKSRLKQLEELMQSADEKIALLESEIASPDTASDYAKLAELCDELERTKQEHDSYFCEWAELCE